MSPRPPNLYPEWDALLDAPADPAAAIDAFLAMARAESNSDALYPHMRVVNPFGGKGMIWLAFDLSEPNPELNTEGNQDHTLFGGDEGGQKRKYKGRRLKTDYLANRAERIAFIPRVLKHPGVRIYRCTNEPKRLVFACRTGADEHFLVFANELATDIPRLAYVTAYKMSDTAFTRKANEDWTRIHPKANKPTAKAKAKKGHRGNRR